MKRLSCLDSNRGDSDRGEIVVGWLVKVSVVLIVCGIALFDAISAGVLRMQVRDAAVSSAFEAVHGQPGKVPTQKFAAEQAARALAETHPDFSIDPASVIVMQDGSVSVTVTGEARTIVAGRIPQLHKWTHASATETGHPAA